MTGARQAGDVCHAASVAQESTPTSIVHEALDIGGIESAALFGRPPGSTTLELAAAAGIDGPALDGLVAAVRNPGHPVARSLVADGPAFDVLPTAPGGPALRSHLPVRAGAGGDGEPIGVLAVAHESPLGEPDRSALIDLAAAAAIPLAREAG